MPIYLLYSSLVFEYVGLVNFFPVLGAAKLNVIIPITTFLVSLFINSRISNKEVFKHLNSKLLLILIFLVLFSWTFNSSPRASGIFQGVLGYFFLYYAIIRIADTKEKLKSVFFVLGACHIAVIMINPDIILKPEIRNYLTASPFLGDGNDFALSLVIVFPLILYLYLDTKVKLFRMLFLVVTVVVVLTIIGTQSRGGSLGLGAILLVMWMRSQQKILGILALCVLVFTTVLFASPQYFTRMGTLSSYQTEGSAKGRLDAWKMGHKMALSKPLTGVGPGNFYDYNGLAAHSIYFLALGELGYPGGMVMLMYVFGNLRLLKRNIKKCKEADNDSQSYEKLFVHLYCGMLGLAVTGAFLSCLYYPHIFVLGALIVAAQRVYELDLEKKIEQQEDGAGGQNGSQGEIGYLGKNH